MALGLSTSSGGGSSDIMDRIEYDARAGRLFRVDREQDATGTWVSKKTPIRIPTQMVFDLANVEVGWLKFANGVDLRLVPLGQPIGPRPEGVDLKGKPAYSQGFRVKVFSPKLLDGVRVWNHTARCVLGAFDALHDEYTAQVGANPGLVPVVEWDDPVPVASGQSTNYAPVLRIVKWVPRPADLGDGAAPAPAPQAAPTSGGHVPPPPPKAPPASDFAADDETEFG